MSLQALRGPRHSGSTNHVCDTDSEHIARFFPKIILVWSEIITWVTWHGARDALDVEMACRTTIICRVSHFVRSKLGVVIRHRQLEGDNCLMVQDGLDIFRSGLQDGDEQPLFLLSYYTAFYGRTKSQHAAFVTVLRKKYANESLWKREKYGFHMDKQCDLREIRSAVREKSRFHTTNVSSVYLQNLAVLALKIKG
ncbi:unnamed protein product [Ranitomeya imitator]|uniref:Uncharacterized protein n=1 Tax=Ranitomeya imitator TaxID=111125 RepID=A0ABN9LZB6_9NEOB|nr:unnamed protein product [Ranitomeya imitator]